MNWYLLFELGTKFRRGGRSKRLLGIHPFQLQGQGCRDRAGDPLRFRRGEGRTALAAEDTSASPSPPLQVGVPTWSTVLFFADKKHPTSTPTWRHETGPPPRSVPPSRSIASWLSVRLLLLLADAPPSSSLPAPARRAAAASLCPPSPRCSDVQGACHPICRRSFHPGPARPSSLAGLLCSPAAPRSGVYNSEEDRAVATIRSGIKTDGIDI